MSSSVAQLVDCLSADFPARLTGMPVKELEVGDTIAREVRPSHLAMESRGNVRVCVSSGMSLSRLTSIGRLCIYVSVAGSI